MVHRESWYLESSLSSELQRLEGEIARGNEDGREWTRLQEEGVIVRAWVLAERLGTLPKMDRQQAEYAYEQTGSKRRFTVEVKSRPLSYYLGEGPGEWMDPQTVPYDLEEAIEVFHMVIDPGDEPTEVRFSIRSISHFTTTGLIEYSITFKDLDPKGIEQLREWALE